MPENTTPVTELTSHYVNQVAGDLEQNLKEQERITAEITALQEQLATLQKDHTILVSMQQALGVTASKGTAVAPDSPVVPAPRKKPTAEPGKHRTGKAEPGARPRARKRSAKRTAGPAAAKAAAGAAQPTLVELVRDHLAQQSEPRSAAEVAEALGKAHPERAFQTKVVRTALESLVARNGAQRTKQGTSVFYTVTATAESAREARPPAE
ncbi:hypothetical protein GCM10010503_54900 [Streptomyces lucensis JCM 4490]|uniref:Regulatory protein n=1 Tax=Streptomyces lucensis JCM 4490 TaxID=1306176 RepID=A0A918JDB8_9ACTN|nr:hypothetical protein [Streptomyces lucensis]GGW70656.1 hypothetical protein GCM10010503_54900 [Streptomyces lucensis JCM 4490]